MAEIVAVGHVGVRARDLAALARFYRETVGLRQVAYFENVVAIFAVGATTTDLFIAPGDPEPMSFDLATDDVDAYRARLAGAGVPCTEPKDDTRTGHRGFSFRDPEGNDVRVMNAHRR